MCGCVACGCAVFLALLRGGVAVFFASLRACVPVCVCARVPAWLRVWVCSCGCARGCVWGGRACVRGPLLVVCCGGFLLSHTPWGAVPLARPGLASRFGMLLGVSPVL